MEFDGFKCPDQMVNDFTPLEFEDLVVLFKADDVDGSGEINPEELRKILHDMDMDFLADQAGDLMAKIDKDGSGILDFAEFVTFVGMVKRGGSERSPSATPRAAMPTSAVEQRSRWSAAARVVHGGHHMPPQATSMHSVHSSSTTPSSATAPRALVGGSAARARRREQGFGGIAKNTREAKMAAAKTPARQALRLCRLRRGQLPQDWLDWASLEPPLGRHARDCCLDALHAAFHPASACAAAMQRMTCARARAPAREPARRLRLSLDDKAAATVFAVPAAQAEYFNNPLTRGSASASA